MQLSMNSADRQVTLPLKVKQIQAQAIQQSSGDDDLFDEYYRTIRFITPAGDAINVNCSAYEAKDLAIVKGAELMPLKKAER
jgi:hypothetical protein